MRCFVALPVPGAIAQALAALSAERRVAFAQARWSHPDDLHVTLQFLGDVTGDVTGEVPGAALAAVPAALATALAHTRSLELLVTDFAVFSGAGVLLAAVAPTDNLLALQRTVAEALRGCGFVPELRPYRPHITLARTRRSLEEGSIRRWSGPIAPPLRLPCVEVVLYESAGAPGSAESRYRPLHAVPLQLPGRL